MEKETSILLKNDYSRLNYVNILNHGFELISKANFIIFYYDLFLHIIRNIVYKNDKIHYLENYLQLFSRKKNRFKIAYRHIRYIFKYL